jgi:hypothetical protein
MRPVHLRANNARSHRHRNRHWPYLVRCPDGDFEMNALAQFTLPDLARALTGQPRIEQEILMIKRISGTMGMRYVVLVTPHGAERGERYEVRKPMLDLLESGRSPESLDLDVYEPEDDQ